MGKRIGRSRHRLRMPQGASWAESLQNELGIRSPSFDGRCAYCGKLVKPGQWHWMRDEFGQLVKSAIMSGIVQPIGKRNVSGLSERR